jgi:uncharacterized membrane protein YqjE
MGETGDRSDGAFATLRRLGGRVLGITHNRLELFAVELEEERARLWEAGLLAGAVLGLGLMTVVTVTFTVAVIFWEEHRVAVLAGFSLFYLLATLALYWRLRRRLQNWRAFSASLAELKEDRKCLEGSNEAESSTANKP